MANALLSTAARRLLLPAAGAGALQSTQHQEQRKQQRFAKCDSIKVQRRPNTSATNIRKRMTSIGRFSMISETLENPSIPTFFIALSGKADMEDMNQVWKKRGIMEKHE